ncbi:hypothetical protein [Streptomyces flaveus]|uniref:hypothetical protein n=1 Tax=Streptomyces flaveus TaxID=66370 RepID=UPI001671833B|nr:hypothetical protein [Streptomyces flaveus]
MTSWTRLYGLLCLEVLHQMDFVLTDMEPLFEQCLGELAETLGLSTEPWPLSCRGSWPQLSQLAWRHVP